MADPLENLETWELALRHGLGTGEFTMKERECDVAEILYHIAKLNRGEGHAQAQLFTEHLWRKYARPKKARR